MMHSPQTAKTIVGQVPNDLNFAMYVASAFHILPNLAPFSLTNLWAATTPPTISVEDQPQLMKEWEDWWHAMVLDHAQNAFRSTRETFDSAYYTPHEQFSNLSPKLQGCCQAVFPSFHRWWTMPAGGHTALHWLGLRVLDQALNVVGQGFADPPEGYHFAVDLVYAGISDHISVTSTYVIMSVPQVPIPTHPPAWLLAKILGLR